jgi:hypothetical protein
MLMDTTIINLALGGVNIKPCRPREIMELSHNQLHGLGITSSKNQEIISKTEINDPQMLTLGVKVEVRNMRQLVEGSMQVFHDNYKQQRRDRIPLPEPTFSLHEASVSALNIKFVRNSSDS